MLVRDEIVTEGILVTDAGDTMSGREMKRNVCREGGARWQMRVKGDGNEGGRILRGREMLGIWGGK